MFNINDFALSLNEYKNYTEDSYEPFIDDKITSKFTSIIEQLYENSGLDTEEFYKKLNAGVDSGFSKSGDTLEEAQNHCKAQKEKFLKKSLQPYVNQLRQHTRDMIKYMRNIQKDQKAKEEHHSNMHEFNKEVKNYRDAADGYELAGRKIANVKDIVSKKLTFSYSNKFKSPAPMQTVA